VSQLTIEPGASVIARYRGLVMVRNWGSLVTLFPLLQKEGCHGNSLHPESQYLREVYNSSAQKLGATGISSVQLLIIITKLRSIDCIGLLAHWTILAP